MFRSPLRAPVSGVLLCGLFAAGCDADAAFSKNPDQFGITPVYMENPDLGGTALVWSENWTYKIPFDPNSAGTSEQTVWATSGVPVNASQAVMEITADHAIFAGSMQQASWNFTHAAGGTSTVFTTSFSSSTVPWLYLPAGCHNLFDPLCVQYIHRPAPNDGKPYTFPFVVGDISLPMETPVAINTVTRIQDPPPGGGIWGTKTVVRESARWMLDPATLVVPVHVHVFTDTSGRSNNAFMGGLTGTSGRTAMATNVRGAFDDYSEQVLNIATAAGSGFWHREYSTRMTRNILDLAVGNPNDAVFDHMLVDCKVQTSLASVDFIAQSAGLEKAEITWGNANDSLPWGSPGTPTATASALMRQYILGVNTRAGVHVFVVGKVNPGSFVSFDLAGIGWPQSGTAPGYAVVAGLSSSNTSIPGAKQILAHEVGHVLGLKHIDTSNPIDGIAAMFSHTLTPAMCSTMRDAAMRLLNPAANNGCTGPGCFGNP